MSKTIKALADELGVSKTAVRKYLTADFRAKYTANSTGNIIEISDNGCKLIAESFRKPPETTANKFAETTENQGLQSEIEFLREQLQAKDRQIEQQEKTIDRLTAALENTTASLQAAQALHAGTIQKQLTAGNETAADSEQKRWYQFWK